MISNHFLISFLLLGCYSDNNVQQNTIADIGFVVDASSSLYSQGFQTEINFVNSVIDAVGPISADGIRISVIVYSDMAALRIKFNDHFNTEDLKQAVSDLPFDDVGETRIDLGLAKANEMFDIENGARGSSKKVRFLPFYQRVWDIKTLFSQLIPSLTEKCILSLSYLGFFLTVILNN